MTYKLGYWLFAYVLTIAAVAVAIDGVRYARKGDLPTHRKRMELSNNLIIFFVVTYAFKMFILGREDKTGWSQMDLIILYIHESFIGLMLIAGVYTRVLSNKFKNAITAAVVPPEHVPLRAKHKLMGKLTLWFAMLALITATMVLYGLYHRAGLI